MAMVGRLKPGVRIGQAQAEMKQLGAELTKANPSRNSFEGFVKPLADQVNGRVRLALWVLAGSVALVMLIVCANLSNLLLARMASRQKEIAIRAALGAGRRRLTAQLLTEGMVLSTAGALVGVVLAVAGTRALTSLDAVSIPLLGAVRTDLTTLGFTVGIAIVTGLVFGLTPALLAGRSAALHAALKDASRGSTESGQHQRVRQALVVSEVALACVLLVGAGLLIRSLIQVLDVDMGFQPTRSATIRVDPVRRDLTRAEENAYFDDVLRRVRAIPGVESAGITDALPLGRNRTWGVRVKPAGERDSVMAFFPRIVSDGYIGAMGIPVRAGRDFSETDTSSSEPVLVINETMARALWPGEDAVGKTLRDVCGADRRVAGVVGDVRHLALEQGSGNELYLPMRQCGDQPSADLVLRSAMPPAALASAIRTALSPIAPNLVSNDIRTVQQIVDRSVSPRRFIVLLLAGFAAFALLLAALGIYGLISYSVNQRTREIGIRIAIGASASEVQRSIVLQTLRLASVGMAIGVSASWLVAESASSLLFGVTARDPGTFIGMLTVLALVATAAGYLPARRGSRIDPMVALRSE
jgi:predicted permease